MKDSGRAVRRRWWVVVSVVMLAGALAATIWLAFDVTGGAW